MSYVATGYRDYGAYNCNCHQDVMAMTVAAESLDAVHCVEVIQHVANPFAAAQEIRVPGGPPPGTCSWR